jgi:hypothetical protein
MVRQLIAIELNKKCLYNHLMRYKELKKHYIGAFYILFFKYNLLDLGQMTPIPHAKPPFPKIFSHL